LSLVSHPDRRATGKLKRLLAESVLDNAILKDLLGKV
jgi:hypothetical protein